MTYNRWDVVLLPFPFTDLSAKKRRPALILFPASYNKVTDLVVLFITSNLKANSKTGDYKLKEWKEAGFPKPSMVRMKFATIDKNLVVKKFAKLTNTDIKAVKKEVQSFLGLK